MNTSKIILALAAIIFTFAFTAVSAHPKVQRTEFEDKEQSKPGNETFYRFSRCYDSPSPKQKAKFEMKNGIAGEEYRWPLGVVPYVWDESCNEDDKEVILKGMVMIEVLTCVIFVERSTQENYVIIQTNDGGCFSSDIGMYGDGSQILNLDRDGGCIGVSTAAHELIHVIGFYHEHSRPDRDLFIDVMWDNIQEKYFDQFNNTLPMETYGVPYNVKSLMHYEAYSTIAKNEDEPIMISKNSSNPIPRTQGELSEVMETDAEKINLMYKCYATGIRAL